MSRGRFLLSVALWAIPVAAQADNLAITAAQTTPVATSATSNGSRGDINLTSVGSIIVTGTTPAVTIDSNNSVTNAGVITASAASNGVAVSIGGAGLSTAALVNNATISATGTGSGNIGVLIAGGALAGSISSGTLGAISVTGDNALGVSVAAPFTGNIAVRSVQVTGGKSTAVAVTAPITGNLTLLGSSTATGAGGNGLLVAAPVSGSVRNAGTISVGTTRAFGANNTVTLGNNAIAGVRISASVGAGVLNDRYFLNSAGVEVPSTSANPTVDTLINGFVIATGTAPALWIGTDAMAPQDVTIGAGDTSFALVNRGQIHTSFGNLGAAVTAVRIGGGGAATVLVGGILQDSTGAILADSFDASAAAINLLAGASVSRLVNAGIILAAASQSAANSTTPLGAGGIGRGILVEAGAVLTAIDNSGTITATSTGTGNGAYAIIDQSGSLTSITNSGTIAVTTSDIAAARRAIDLSASSGAVTVTNSGTILGDIVFGAGNATLALSRGSITGTIAFGSGSNLLTLNGTALLSQTITASAPLAITLADTARLDLSKTRAALSSISAGGSAVLVVPILSGAGLSISGSAAFTGSSAIELSIRSLAPSQSVNILTAAGGISTDHLNTLVNPLGDRFLFAAGTPVINGNTLSISLARKSAAEIGLVGAQATLFNQSLTALPDGSVEAVAIANLPSAASIAAAYRQITPPSFGRAAMRAAQSYADTGFGAAAERLAVLNDMREGTNGASGLGVWGQEIGNLSQQQAGTNETAFRNSTFGVAIGADISLGSVDALGAALVANWTSVRQTMGDGLPEAQVSITAVGIQPYAMTSWKGIFAQVNGLVAHVGYTSSRATSIGNLSNSIIASWNGVQLGAGLTIGARIKAGPVRITPSNSLSWTRLHQDGYSEVGGGNFNLAVAAQTDTAVTNTSKLSLAWLLPIGEGHLELEGHGAYVHQFNTDPLVTRARYVSGGDTMVLAGDAITASGKVFGGGVGYRADTLALRLRYDRRQADSYAENAFVATLGVAF
jgi:uncharacterized protein with beta-barrel porin domain